MWRLALRGTYSVGSTDAWYRAGSGCEQTRSSRECPPRGWDHSTPDCRASRRPVRTTVNSDRRLRDTIHPFRMWLDGDCGKTGRFRVDTLGKDNRVRSLDVGAERVHRRSDFEIRCLGKQFSGSDNDVGFDQRQKCRRVPVDADAVECNQTPTRAGLSDHCQRVVGIGKHRCAVNRDDDPLQISRRSFDTRSVQSCSGSRVDCHQQRQAIRDGACECSTGHGQFVTVEFRALLHQLRGATEGMRRTQRGIVRPTQLQLGACKCVVVEAAYRCELHAYFQTNHIGELGDRRIRRCRTVAGVIRHGVALHYESGPPRVHAAGRVDGSAGCSTPNETTANLGATR